MICRICQSEYTPRIWQKDRKCLPCKNQEAFLWRKKMKDEGRPCKSPGGNAEYWRNKDKEPDRLFKQKVRLETRNAVATGILVKTPCSVCGDENSEAHHEDYNKPLEVIWFCRKHHRQYHSAHRDEMYK